MHDDLPAEVYRRSEDHGLKLQEAEAVIVDATPVKSAARPRTHIDAPQDRGVRWRVVVLVSGHLVSGMAEAIGSHPLMNFCS